jgi:hypothetical protein
VVGNSWPWVGVWKTWTLFLLDNKMLCFMYNDIEFAVIAIRRIISGLQLHPWHIFEHNLVSKFRFSSNLGLLLITGMIFFINYLTDFSCFAQDSQNRFINLIVFCFTWTHHLLRSMYPFDTEQKWRMEIDFDILILLQNW